MTATIAAPARAEPARRSRPYAVSIHGLRKRFPVARHWLRALRRPAEREYKVALDGVTLQVETGEIVGLLGCNGAGKTTLLKILSTLVTPDAGTAEVAGFDVRGDPARVRRALAPVTADERSLDWRLSSRENLRFFGALHGFRGAELGRRVEEVLATVELLDAGDRQVGTFSSGMRQRLLVARGLLSRPAVLLLDEPTRSLDPLAARTFRNFLRRQITGGGGTALLATHSADEALELCDRVAVLGAGRVLALGTPAELARGFGDERFRAWTRSPHHAAFAQLRGVAVRVPPEPPVDGWSVVELDLGGGGPDRAAAVLSSLVAGGVEVGRFEKVELSLAELIERVVRRPGGDHA